VGWLQVGGVDLPARTCGTGTGESSINPNPEKILVRRADMGEGSVLGDHTCTALVTGQAVRPRITTQKGSGRGNPRRGDGMHVISATLIGREKVADMPE